MTERERVFAKVQLTLKRLGKVIAEMQKQSKEVRDRSVPDVAIPYGRHGTAAREQALLSGIWTPVPEGPHEAFVERLHRTIAAFAESAGVEKPFVEVELMDTGRFVLDRIEPEPGFGMITLYVQRVEEDEPDALVIPIGSIRRIELRKAAEERVGVGFSVPRPA